MSSPPPKIVVIATTCYPSMNDSRFLLALETVEEAAHLEIPMILIDSSPTEDIRDKLRVMGTVDGKSFVDVLVQLSKGKKGSALREAVDAANRKVKSEWNNDNAEAIVCFQEPEKPNMLKHWKTVVAHMVETQADVSVPRRSDISFKATYPREQYYSENFGNMYLDALAKGADFEPSVDWLFGPLAWRLKLSSCWLDFKEGELWDAQICPMIHAQRYQKAKVVSCDIDYLHPKTMKDEEEECTKFIEKRLMQLNHVFDNVGKVLKEEDTKVAATSAENSNGGDSKKNPESKEGSPSPEPDSKRQKTTTPPASKKK
jgi:hypothetical protein